MLLKILPNNGFMKISLKPLNYNQFIHSKINHGEETEI